MTDSRQDGQVVWRPGSGVSGPQITPEITVSVTAGRLLRDQVRTRFECDFLKNTDVKIKGAIPMYKYF